MLISIAVRACNDASTISGVLTALTQQLGVETEILVCDDGSTDDTLKICGEFPQIKMVQRPSGRYIPGKTLNNLVRSASGEIIAFVNADAIPLDVHSIGNLVAPFVDENVIATYGNQVCRPDALQLVRKDHARAFGSGDVSRKWTFFFSLAASAIRREALLRRPFDESIQYSEDVAWASKCAVEGKRIVYVADARFEHSHNYTLRQLWKRFYNEGVANGQIWGVAPSTFTWQRQWLAECVRDLFWIFRHGGWSEIPSIPIRRFLQRYGAARGARDYLREH